MWWDMMWCDVMWCDVMWCDVVWCGVVWCGVLPFSSPTSVFYSFNSFQLSTHLTMSISITSSNYTNSHAHALTGQVFEDSFHQLRMRTAEEMGGRLQVNFHGEEGTVTILLSLLLLLFFRLSDCTPSFLRIFFFLLIIYFSFFSVFLRFSKWPLCA